MNRGFRALGPSLQAVAGKVEVVRQDELLVEHLATRVIFNHKPTVRSRHTTRFVRGPVDRDRGIGEGGVVGANRGMETGSCQPSKVESPPVQASAERWTEPHKPESIPHRSQLLFTPLLWRKATFAAYQVCWVCSAWYTAATAAPIARLDSHSATEGANTRRPVPVLARGRGHRQRTRLDVDIHHTCHCSSRREPSSCRTSA